MAYKKTRIILTAAITFFLVLNAKGFNAKGLAQSSDYFLNVEPVAEYENVIRQNQEFDQAKIAFNQYKKNI